MPLLIFHCRTRLFLALIQQWTILDGTPTLRLQVQLTKCQFPITIQYKNYLLIYEKNVNCLIYT